MLRRGRLSWSLRASGSIWKTASRLQHSIVPHREDARNSLFSSLKLHSFSDDELRSAFAQLKQQQQERLDKLNPDKHSDLASCEEFGISLESEQAFRTSITDFASTIDSRVLPIAASFVGAGVSIGCIIPLLPVRRTHF